MGQRLRATLPRRSRVLLVDHHPIVRKGLWHLINAESDLVACGEAEDRNTAWKPTVG